MTMTETRWAVGQQVTVDHDGYPGVWTVEKVNPVKLKLRKEGSPRLLNAPKDMCRPYDGTTPAAAVVRTVALREMPPQNEGAIVRYVGRNDKNLKSGALMVVVADKYEKVNVTLLGGLPNGGYYRMPYQYLEVVDPETWALIED